MSTITRGQIVYVVHWEPCHDYRTNSTSVPESVAILEVKLSGLSESSHDVADMKEFYSVVFASPSSIKTIDSRKPFAFTSREVAVKHVKEACAHMAEFQREKAKLHEGLATQYERLAEGVA